MKRRHGFFMVLTVVATVLALMVGCKPGPVKITFTTLSGGGPESDAFNEIFAAFNKSTGHTVNMQNLPNVNDYENIIKTRFATNDPPDLFYFFAGANEYNTLQADKNLVDLSKEELLKNLSTAVRDFYTVNGKVYGVAWGTYNALGVLYNKDVFAKVGVQLPKNYADFLAICEKVKKAGITPIYEAGKTGWPVQIFSLSGFQTFVLPSIGGSEGVRKLGANQLRIKDIPAIRDVFERQLALKKLGYFNKDLAAGTYELQQEALATGKAAMALQGDWMLPSVAAKFPDDVNTIGFFSLPSDMDEGTPTLYPPKQLMVAKNGKHVKETLQLLRFMTTADSLGVWHKHNPGIPVYTNVETKIFAAQQDIFNLIKAGKGAINVQLILPSNYVPDYDKVCVELIMNGNVDATIAKMDSTYVQQGKDKKIPGF
jgi:raffinose/stachyose/melibiose transport system substrate-binding protein